MILRTLLFALCLLATTAAGLAQTTWTLGRTNLANVTGAYGIAFGNGRFVVTLEGSTGSPAAAWSVDGVTWHASNLTLFTQGSIIFARGAFYLAANTRVFRSVDGENWQTVYQSPTGTYLREIASDGTSLMIGHAKSGVSTVVYSADGTTWSTSSPFPAIEPSNPNTWVTAVHYGVGRYWVTTQQQAADGRMIVAVASTSNGGQSWKLAPNQGNAGIGSGSGRVAFFGTTSWITFDGETFVSQSVPLSVLSSGQIVYAGGRFLGADTLIASSDLKSWDYLAPAPGLSEFVQMRGIAYGNGRYVAAGWVFTPTVADVIATLIAPAAPMISSQPESQTVEVGRKVTFSVSLDNPELGTTFQWQRNGVAIPGATALSYTRANVAVADSGRYAVVVTNAQGPTLSEPATLTVVPFSRGGRIGNLSVLTTLDTPDANLMLGFSVAGGAGKTKSILARAGGPSLLQFGVTNYVPDPRLELFAGSTKVDENDNWDGTTSLINTGASVGAYPFVSAESKDSALHATAVAEGRNAVNVIANHGDTGAVLAEIYDTTVADTITGETPRLVNASVRHRLGAAGILSAGFVILGETPKTILVRAIGPSLAPWNITDAHWPIRSCSSSGAAREPRSSATTTGAAPWRCRRLSPP